MPLKSWSALLEDAGDAANGALPQGDYDVKVAAAEAKMSGNGNLYFKTQLEVINGPYGPKDGKPGRKLTTNITLVTDNEVALGFFFRKMAAFGIDRSFFAANPGDDQVASALVGRTCRVQVKIRNYQGNDTNDVAMFFPISKTPGAPTPPAPPVVPQAQNAQPVQAGATPPVAPATQPVAAAVAAPAAAPAQTEVAPPPPVQPEVPAVPDAQAPAAPAAQQLPPPPPAPGTPF